MIVSVTLYFTTCMIVLIIGVLTTTLFFCNKFSNLLLKKCTALFFLGAFAFYIAFELIGAFFDATITLRKFYFIPKAFSDLGFFAFVICWLQIIEEISERQLLLSRKSLLVVTAVYYTTVEFFVFVHSGVIDIEVSDTKTELLIKSLDLIYDLLIVVMASEHIIRMVRNRKAGKVAQITNVLSVILIVYMLIILYFDMVGYRIVLDDTSYVRFDPMIAAYLIGCAVLLGYDQRSKGICLEQECAQSEDCKNDRLESFYEKYRFTKREIDIIKLLQQGYENDEIANQAFISENTVKRHLNHIFSKTNTKNKYELLAIMMKELVK